MELFLVTLVFVMVAASKSNGVAAAAAEEEEKLFVFGDSYADTGNLGKLGPALTRSWYEPYGMTFPRRPTGRFSDGRILTDFFASFLGVKSPIPFKYRKLDKEMHHSGMNFAVGGAGVFDTGSLQKNLGSQIDDFKSLINGGTFTKHDVESSVALVSIAGNDYAYFLKNNPHGNLTQFINNVTTQLALDLKHIHDLGVRTVVVTNLHPLQCTPYMTRDNEYRRCEEGGINMEVVYHNAYLEKSLNGLVDDDGRNTTFFILDLYSAFLSVIHQEPETDKFVSVLKPCCMSIGDAACGQRDDGGAKQYTLCYEPYNSFYWDSVHPTQAGWAAVFHLLKPSLHSFFP